MLIDVLTCRLDGTQELEQIEVPDDAGPSEPEDELISDSEALEILLGGND